MFRLDIDDEFFMDGLVTTAQEYCVRKISA